MFPRLVCLCQPTRWSDEITRAEEVPGQRPSEAREASVAGRVSLYLVGCDQQLSPFSKIPGEQFECKLGPHDSA